MYSAASGILQDAASKKVRTQNDTSFEDDSRFKIFFPSEKTVNQSRGGPGYFSLHIISNYTIANKILIVPGAQSVYNPITGTIPHFQNH
jgi:hypothetical protein